MSSILTTRTIFAEYGPEAPWAQDAASHRKARFETAARHQHRREIVQRQDSGL